MSHTFEFTGTYSAKPGSAGCSSSGEPSESASLREVVSLDGPLFSQEILLSADAPVAVNFGALASANVIIIKAKGGKVRVRYTSADGALAEVPADTLHIIITKSVAITAIDLTRVAAQETRVIVTLGKIAS